MTFMFRAPRRAVALMAICAGCASAPIPVSLVGPQNDIAQLAGEWSGSYRGEDSHRTGSIRLRLAAGDTVAYGDVVMIPREYEQQTWDRAMTTTLAPAPRLLQITFVRIADGRVSGVLDPYMDPDCDCLVLTTFTGQFTRRHTIEGTFTTRIAGTPYVNVGRWEVKRRNPLP